MNQNQLNIRITPTILIDFDRVWAMLANTNYYEGLVSGKDYVKYED